jgi:hypothetical protein
MKLHQRIENIRDQSSGRIAMRPYKARVFERSVSDDAISLSHRGDCHDSFGASQ